MITTDPSVDYTGSQYYARVECPGANDSIQGIESRLDVPITHTCIPPVPTIVSINVVKQTVKLTWTAVQDGTMYRLYRDGDTNQIYYGPNGTFDDRPATGAHTYTLRAENLCGLSAAAPFPAITMVSVPCPLPPGTPSGLRASPPVPGPKSIRMIWNPAAGTGIKYTLYRLTSSTSNDPVPLGTVTTTAFTHSGLTPNTTYFYRIQSENSCGDKSAMSSPAVPVRTAR